MSRPVRERAEYEGILGAPFGAIGFRIADGRLCGIDLLPRAVAARHPTSALGRRVAEALRRYLEDGTYRFALPLELRGTAYQRRIWGALQAIEPGTVRTYGEIAAHTGGSARAVGGACRANPVPLVVPCHRVVAASGLGGFAGRTAGKLPAIKAWLIAHEGRGRGG